MTLRISDHESVRQVTATRWNTGPDMIICKQCGHSNAEGTAFCKNAECGAFLEWTGEHVQTGTIPAVDLERRKGKAAVTAAISTTELAADPGGEVTLEVQVANKGRVVDQVAVYVGGEAGRWATVRPDRVNLLPGTADVAHVTFAVPRSGITAGTKSFVVEAVSGEDPAARATADGTLTVGTFHELTAKLTPRNVEAARRATYQLVLENGGNTLLRTALTAEDENAALTFTLRPPHVSLGPGQEVSVALDVTAKQQPRVGTPQAHRFHVIVEPDAGSPLSLEGTFTQPAATARVTKGRGLALRIILTLLGGLMMLGGAQLSWLEGISGVDLTYDQYVNAVFDANVDEPPDGVPTVAASVALPAIVFAGLAVLGLLGRKARLTKAAAVLALLVFVGFAITVAQAGFSVGGGVILVIVGAVVALVGGLMANVARP